MVRRAGFTFLCVHVTPPPGDATLGGRLDLEPLRIGFPSERPWYPAKFSSRQGAFALSLAVLTSRPLGSERLASVGSRLRGSTPRYPNLWTERPLPDALREAWSSGGRADVPRWTVNAIRSRGFNSTGVDGQPAIASWTDDVFFDLGDASDEPPGWYYGDRELSFVEQALREHGIAIGVFTLLALVVVWRIRRRLRARPA